MKGSLRLNHRKHHIILRSSHPINTKISINLSTRLSSRTHNKITTSHTTGRTSIQHNNHNPREVVVETSEGEVEEEDLVEEEAKLRAITMDNRVTTPEIA